MFNFTSIILSAPAILFCLTIHEYAHGLVALRLGDPTAKYTGRLTLNPLKHLDPIGTICLFLFRFGWAKPVPVNPTYFHNPSQGMMITSLAGPLANFLAAIGFGLILRLVNLIAPTANFLIIILEMFVFFNLILGAFNLIPIPPLDGSKIIYYLLPKSMADQYAQLEKLGIFILFGIIFLGQIIGYSIFGMIIFPIVRFFSLIIVGHSIV